MMRKSNLFISFSICIIGSLFIGTFARVHAQELTLSISPPSLEVLIKPGKSLTQAYKIVNGGEATIVTPHIVEIDENGIRENPSFVPEDWFSLLNTDITLEKPFLMEPGQERQLILRISPPKGTPEKDFYRALLISTDPTPSSEFSQSAISQRIGAPVIVTVSASGLLEKKAVISRFDVPTILDSFDPLIVDLTLKNTGRSYVHANGSLTLTSPIGKATYPIVPKVVLSGQTKEIAVETTSNSIQSTSTLNLPGFYLGKYQIDADVHLDESTIKIYQSKTIYAFPWKILSGLMIIILLVVLIRRKHRVKKKPIGPSPVVEAPAPKS